MTDITWVGRVSNIKKSSGTTQDGREWTRTSFLLSRFKQTNGEQKETKWWVSAFQDFDLTEGDWFVCGLDLERRKKKDSDDFETVLTCRWADPYEAIEEEIPPAPQPKAQPQRQSAPAQKPATGYSAPKPQSRGYSSPAPANPKGVGPEGFEEDNIPF